MKEYLVVKALHDRIGSRSNDDLDHILGKKIGTGSIFRHGKLS